MKVSSILSCVSLAAAGIVQVELESRVTNMSIINPNLTAGAGNHLFFSLARAISTDNTVIESLINGINMYYATLYIGSDRQKVSPLLDTGSSDLWVMTEDNPACSGNNFCNGMMFNPSTSTSFKNTSQRYAITYLDNTGASGWMSQDTIDVGGATITNAYFALANQTSSTLDVFGVGLSLNEATVTLYNTGGYTGFKYDNTPIELKNQGYINHVAYSLYLNDLTASEGSILFGGVDHSKYTGTLGLVPLVQPRTDITDIVSFHVMLHGINVTVNNAECELASNMAIAVLLDSGTSYAILPPDIIASMARAYGYTWNQSAGFYEGQCSGFAVNSFELNFSGVKLNVPASSLTAPSGRSDNPCILAIAASTNSNYWILGDNFLRNFYVVYDLENLQIALAQAAYTDSSNVEEIGSSIPGATSAASYSSTSFSTSYVTHAGNACVTSSSITSSSSSSTSSSSSASTSSATTSSTSSASSNTTTSSTSSTSSASSNTTTSSTSSTSSTYTPGNTTSSATPLINGTTSSTPTSTPTSVSPLTDMTVSLTGPTTLTTNGQTYTITSPTVLTITDCSCTNKPTTTQNTPTASTYVVSSFVTSCPSATTLTFNDVTYTVTGSTVLTITDCPCTLTKKHTTTATNTNTKTSTVNLVFTHVSGEPHTTKYANTTASKDQIDYTKSTTVNLVFSHLSGRPQQPTQANQTTSSNVYLNATSQAPVFGPARAFNQTGSAVFNSASRNMVSFGGLLALFLI